MTKDSFNKLRSELISIQYEGDGASSFYSLRSFIDNVIKDIEKDINGTATAYKGVFRDISTDISKGANKKSNSFLKYKKEILSQLDLLSEYL